MLRVFPPSRNVRLSYLVSFQTNTYSFCSKEGGLFVLEETTYMAVTNTNNWLSDILNKKDMLILL